MGQKKKSDFSEWQAERNRIFNEDNRRLSVPMLPVPGDVRGNGGIPPTGYGFTNGRWG